MTKEHRERGLIISDENVRSVADAFADLDLEWIVRFKIPASAAASKNSIYGRSAALHRRPFIKKTAREYRDVVTLLARQAMKGVPVKHDKIWLDIFVEKKHHKGDAVNVIDLICDAIKVAIPIDDRWYSIRRLDWSINKRDPHIFIGIAQEAGATDSRACSLCGQIRPMTDFTNNRDNKLGKGHICIACRAPRYPKGPNKIYR